MLSLPDNGSSYMAPFELECLSAGQGKRRPLKSSPADHRVEAVQPTGIPILDKVSGGGIPRPSSVALMGPIGSGKSALVRELVANFLRQGCQLLYYCIDDPADVVKLGLEDHHIAVTKIEEEGRLEFVDMFSLGAQKLAESLPKMDPGDILEEARRVYQYVQVMRFATQIARAVTISVLHTEVVDVNVENATANLADGVIEMRKRQGEVLLKGGTLKVLRIGRNPTPSRGYFYQITQQGIVFSSTPVI